MPLTYNQRHFYNSISQERNKTSIRSKPDLASKQKSAMINPYFIEFHRQPPFNHTYNYETLTTLVNYWSDYCCLHTLDHHLNDFLRAVLTAM